MIELASLFLGFVLGVHTVELAVESPVAAVAVLLDGREVARLEAPPWEAEVDFGTALEPHRLEAVAFDAAGRELGRARSLINYDRGDYRANLVLDTPRNVRRAGGRTGRLIWAAVLHQDPLHVDLRFDGAPLALRPDGRFTLPPFDPEDSHFLEAELTFADGHVIRTELPFGGRFGDRVTSALTAVPISSPPGRPWSLDEVGGWLEHDAQPLEAFAARAEQGRLIVVPSARGARARERLARRSRDVFDSATARFDTATARFDTATARFDAVLGETDFAVTVISPRPLKAFAGTFELRSLGTVGGPRGLHRVLAGRGLDFRGEKRKKKEHLWDALALAGRHAASSNRPRAVLLMLGAKVEDHSVITLQQALHYLHSVRVPVFAWAPDAATPAALGLKPSVRTFHGPDGIDAIIRRGLVEVASQTVVWLQGEYLPHELSLGRGAPPDVALVR